MSQKIKAKASKYLKKELKQKKDEIEIIKINTDTQMHILSNTIHNVRLTDDDLNNIHNCLTMLFYLSSSWLYHLTEENNHFYSEIELNEIRTYVNELIGDPSPGINLLNRTRIMCNTPKTEIYKYIITYQVSKLIDYYMIFPKIDDQVVFVKGLENIVLNINLHMNQYFVRFKPFIDIKNINEGLI